MSTSTAVARPAPSASSQALSLAPMNPPQAWAFCEWLAGTPLLPDAYRRQPASVLWALEYGRALGLDVVTTICSIHVIKGKPAQSADMMLSRARGAGHRVRIVPERTRCVVTITRADDPEFETVIEWTLDDAVTACLCEMRDDRPYARDDKGRPTSWEKYPRAMLRSRALAEAVRTACPEVLYGAIHTPEELGAPVDVDGNPITVIPSAVEPGAVEYIGQPDEGAAEPRVIRAARAEAGDWAVPNSPPVTGPSASPTAAVSADAQDFAQRGADTVNSVTWRLIWKEAFAAGVLDTPVDAPDTGAAEPLGEYLTRRGHAISTTRASGTSSRGSSGTTPAVPPAPTTPDIVPGDTATALTPRGDIGAAVPATVQDARTGTTAEVLPAAPTSEHHGPEEIAVALAEMLDAARGVAPGVLTQMFLDSYGRPPEAATLAELRQMRDFFLEAP